MVENPFPKELPDGRVIVDQRCKCGCLQSSHHGEVVFGNGYCEGCPKCSKFVWKSFVFKGDNA